MNLIPLDIKIIMLISLDNNIPFILQVLKLIVVLLSVMLSRRIREITLVQLQAQSPLQSTYLYPQVSSYKVF